MILSNIDIQAALDAGRLKIEPAPTPRSGEGSPYGTSAVDLRMGNEFVLVDELPMAFDLRRPDLSKLQAQNCRRVIPADGQPFVLEPHRFVLAKTLERISLPILSSGPYYAARVEGRSSYARCGIIWAC